MITDEIRDLDQMRAAMIGKQAASKITARGISGWIIAGERAVIRDVDFHFGEVKVWLSPAEDRSVCVILRPGMIEIG